MKECPACSHCFDDKYNNCPQDGRLLVNSFACEIILGGRFILEQRLGKGGMATVFKAKHKFLKSFHAIKIISPEVVREDASLLIRFHQEAVLAASIHHPNVVTVTDYGVENDDMPFLVMEFIEGISLHEYLRREKRLAPEKILEILQQIVHGLSQAHQRGIIHRDLKPLNIMLKNGLSLDKAVKVLDFGLAKIKASESYASLVQAKTTNVLGSPQYMSPEQWSNENIDNRADIYSIGVMLFQMLTGDVPFKGDSIVNIMYQHLHNLPPSFASLGVSVPSQIEWVVQKALAKNQEKRYATVEHFLADYEEALLQANRNPSLKLRDDIAVKPFKSDASPNRVPQIREQGETEDFEKSYNLVYFTSQQNETLNSFLNQPKPLEETRAGDKLAEEFLHAQNRVEEARNKADEADKLAQEFAQAQRTAEEARRKALQAQQKLEEDARRRVHAEMESKLAAERQAREKAEAEAKRLLEEVRARKAAEEKAKASAQAALEAQQRAEEERRKAENEAQQRQIEEQTRRRAEEAAIRLAAEAAEAKKKYEEAKKEAEAEAYRRLEAEQKRKKIEAEIKRNEEYEAERRKIVEAQAAKQIKEQAERLEKQALEAEKKANEARILVENEAKKRQEAEAARIKAEEEARCLAEEIIRAQKRLEEMQQFAESESRKREQEAEARKKAEDSVRSLSEKAKQEEIQKQANSFKAQNSSQNINDESFVVGKNNVLFGWEHNTKERLLEDTSSSELTNTNQISKGFNPAVLFGGVFTLFLMGVFGLFMIYNFVINPSTTGNEATEQRNPTAAPSAGKSGNLPLRLSEKMVKVSGGSFQMGRNDVSPKELHYGVQYPAHTVPVDDFYIDRTEVSNKEYYEFALAARHKLPKGWQNGKPSDGRWEFPVTNVSYFDANAFAAWISKQNNISCRLPSEEEWEYAARNGSRQNIYPWGDNWIPGRANIESNAPKEVGTTADETAVGQIKDMIGNVMEWTSSPYTYYSGFPENEKGDIGKNNITLRGLSFLAKKSGLQKTNLFLTFRQGIEGNSKYEYLGFRLVCKP